MRRVLGRAGADRGRPGTGSTRIWWRWSRARCCPRAARQRRWRASSRGGLPRRPAAGAEGRVRHVGARPVDRGRAAVERPPGCGAGGGPVDGRDGGRSALAGRADAADRKHRHRRAVGRVRGSRAGCNATSTPAPTTARAADWSVGHFVNPVAVQRGRGGAVVTVRDTYPALGGGVHLQPASRFAAALRRDDGREGGVLCVCDAGRAVGLERELARARVTGSPLGQRNPPSPSG